MRALKLNAYITPDHRVELDLPADVPEGEAEVILLLNDAPENQPDSLRAFTERLGKLPSSGRSKAEIDEYVRQERDSWE